MIEVELWYYCLLHFGAVVGILTVFAVLMVVILGVEVKDANREA